MLRKIVSAGFRFSAVVLSPPPLEGGFRSTCFVDATHIKFAQGDATDMFNAVRVVGQLKAEVLEYR